MMIPSDEKIRAITHRIAAALEASPEVKVADPDGVRRAVKKEVEAAVGQLRGIHQLAQEKIQSLSRNVEPGTSEWDNLFAKYVAEEYSRRGI